MTVVMEELRKLAAVSKEPEDVDIAWSLLAPPAWSALSPDTPDLRMLRQGLVAKLPMLGNVKAPSIECIFASY